MQTMMVMMMVRRVMVEGERSESTDDGRDEVVVGSGARGRMGAPGLRSLSPKRFHPLSHLALFGPQHYRCPRTSAFTLLLTLTAARKHQMRMGIKKMVKDRDDGDGYQLKPIKRRLIWTILAHLIQILLVTTQMQSSSLFPPPVLGVSPHGPWISNKEA